MRRSLLAIIVFIVLSALMACIRSPVYAACSPPTDYSSCGSSPFGTNGVALMDRAYNPIETNFADLRRLATQSDPATQNQRLQATIIMTDGTIADYNRTMQIFQNAEKYGIDITIRTWGNAVEEKIATQMGADLSKEVADFQKQTGRSIRVELGNEPNLETSGTYYAAAFAAFVKSCTNCEIYLPSLGGPDLAGKSQFLREFFANQEAVSAAKGVDGIVFNSYADTPQKAVTDWIYTLNLWQQNGLDTSKMKFFLTETGPPDPSPDYPNLDSFLAGIAQEYLRIRNDSNDANYSLFRKLDGLTYFIWTKDEKLLLIFVDQNGKVSKLIALGSANVPGAIPIKTSAKASGKGSKIPVSYADESEAPCPFNEGGVQNDITSPLLYRPDKASPPIPEMRGDANLNLQSAVKGLHCGQSKGTPINLQEVAPYKLMAIPYCKSVGWAGEIQMNYAAPPDVNFRIPFAQELADQWAGTWDTEHVSETDMKRLENFAYGPVSTATTIDGPKGQMTRDMVRAYIENKSGMLKYYLAPITQDIMKCDFINYVKKQGSTSMYNNFSVDGTLLTNIPCPPTVPTDRYPGNTSMTSDAWSQKWSATWKKIALIPNERATGRLNFLVCDDRVYYDNQAYPEVFRMGLAANALFQLFTPKSSQDKFYKDGYTDLIDPYKDGTLIGQKPAGPVLSFRPKASSEIAQNSVSVLSAGSVVRSAEQHTIFGDLSAFVNRVASTLAGYLPQKITGLGRSSKLLAQATQCFGMNAGPTSSRTNADGSMDVDMKVDVIGLSGGKDGHIQFFVNGESQATQYGWNKSANPTYSIQAPSVHIPAGGSFDVTYGVKIDECAPQFDNYNQFGCTLNNTKGTLSTTCDSNITAPGGGGESCDPLREACQCKETKTCAYIDPTRRAQLGPSDTEIWKYNKNHIMLGVDWADFNAGLSESATPDFVRLQWNVPAWQATTRPLPAGCKIVPFKGAPACNGPQDDIACGAYDNACNEGQGLCGEIICTKVHDRVVDVYNNVPFLASAWKQIAGYSTTQASGIFNTWKTAFNPSITGTSQTLSVGCTDNPNVVFDANGRFVPNPGASEIVYSFNQGFGDGPADAKWNNFGKGEVTVTMTKPAAEAKSKITFYRIGGLCNANTWVSQNELAPIGLKNSALLSGMSGQAANTSSNFSNIASTPPTTGGATVQTVPLSQVPQIANQVASVLPSVPRNETPAVSTITNAANLTPQTQFASVQNGDQILVYRTGERAVVYRPSTQQVIAQMPTVSFAVRNGTTNTASADTLAQRLLQTVPNAVIVDRNDAQKKNYAETIIVDPSKANGSQLNFIANLLRIKTGPALPADEPAPSAKFLIIVGTDAH